MTSNVIRESFFSPFALLRRKLRFKLQRRVSLAPAKASGKKALVSYVVHPFIISKAELDKVPHTNPFECLDTIAILLDAGYEVDVIDWTDAKFVPKKRYDLFIDAMENMERLAPFLPPECVKIFYITGAHWSFQNSAERKRLAELRSRRGVDLSPRRQIHESRNIEYCDFAIALGSDFAKETYSYARKEIESIPLPWNILFDSPDKKDFDAARKNFVWLGGGGAVHKGLDVVLEAFSKLPEYTLTVCGPVQAESDFIETYEKELFENPSVRVVGRINLRSDEFKEIVRNSLALIYPSCSEGQSGSVVASLHAGLIPLISYESGVDVAGFGKILEGHSPEYLRQEIVALSNLPAEALRKKAVEAWKYARTSHSREVFRKSVEEILRKRNLI